MTTLSEVARWCYKNPGVWSVKQIGEAAGIPHSTVGHAMLRLAELEPKVCQRVQAGVYLIRPPEAVLEPPAPRFRGS